MTGRAVQCQEDTNEGYKHYPYKHHILTTVAALHFLERLRRDLVVLLVCLFTFSHYYFSMTFGKGKNSHKHTEQNFNTA